MPRLKGYATVVFDHSIAVNDIKIIQAAQRMCLGFPKDDGLENTRYESVVPLNRETREYIESLVLKAYRIGGDYFLREDVDDGARHQAYGDSHAACRFDRLRPENG